MRERGGVQDRNRKQLGSERRYEFWERDGPAQRLGGKTQ